jgi:hypothetical protein
MPTPNLTPAPMSKPAGNAVAPHATAARHTANQPGLQVKTIAEDRRRGQRVLLRIRAIIHLTTKLKDEEVLPVSTLSLNTAGAMLVCPRNLAAQTRFVLEHAGTNEKVECHVVSASKHTPEGFHVPIAFDVPSPNFWKIDFPPEDWKPHDDM